MLKHTVVAIMHIRILTTKDYRPYYYASIILRRMGYNFEENNVRNIGCLQA